MAEYLHGAYGVINTVGMKVADESQGAIVYIGTAPVHMIEGGANNVNVPILVRNMAEAKKYFGYSDNWADYTLCEAMYVHFQLKGVGPLILINVLDPTDSDHKNSTKTTASKTPANGAIVIASAEAAILDSITVKTQDSTPVTKEKGTDYTVSYNIDRKEITIRELSSGALGTDALTVEYDTIKPSGVAAADVIGSSDGLGMNTGVYAIKDVYTVTGYIPAFIAAPGFSSVPTIHAAMYENSKKINGHWDAYMFVDIPITYNSSAVTLNTAATFKSTNNYNHENETVYFPLAEDASGKIYHLSVLAAANFQERLIEHDGIPYDSASNTECTIIQNLYLGAGNTGRVYDDSIINEKLNKNGIASAAFVGGRWAIWGAHSADYDQSAKDYINVSDTNRMMLYYISNDFQQRRTFDVDKILTANDIKSIVSEEQARLDALVNINALSFGAVNVKAEADAASDAINGDWTFEFNVTTVPHAKSLTAIVSWTDEGFVTFFEDLT